MVRLTAEPCRRNIYLFVATLLLLFLFERPASVLAQSPQSEPLNLDQSREELVRLEKREVSGGAELITIYARRGGLAHSTVDSQTQSGTPREQDREWIPLVAVLRDTLGDTNADNDRLRYVWALAYTRPSARQRAASAIPFLYTRVGNTRPSVKEPPELMDLAAADRDVWQAIFQRALQSVLFDTLGMPVRASTRSYQRNIGDYRKSHIIRALSVLSLYQTLKREQLFSDAELQDIQARLLLTEKAFGGIVNDQNLAAFYQKQSTKNKETRALNWELLRQQAEANDLYFEPLEMPDGSATHALVWIARSDLEARAQEHFDARFLSIKNPWTGKRVLGWKGYTETRYVDTDNRPVTATTPGARAVEMIPLALYGLEGAKIPLLLVDFRDTLNPKRREMSRRLLQDVTKNVLALSQFGDLPYFLSHRLFDFVTGRRGVDINQPSRLRAYSQLKLMLSLSNSLSPALQAAVTRRLETLSLNPAENDLETDARLARDQHAALLAYAARPDGLPARLDRDRRSEMTELDHAGKSRFVFKLANLLSFGKYTHREPSTPDLLPRLDLARSFAYHTRFLKSVSRSSPQIEVSWDIEEVKRSLQFITSHAAVADSQAARVVAEIFSRTQDHETRLICLDSLSRINNVTAKSALTQISQDTELDLSWRQLSAQYLEQSAGLERPLDSFGNKAGAERGQQ
jgi:hypothetical protein